MKRTKRLWSILLIVVMTVMQIPVLAAEDAAESLPEPVVETAFGGLKGEIRIEGEIPSYTFAKLSAYQDGAQVFSETIILKDGLGHYNLFDRTEDFSSLILQVSRDAAHQQMISAEKTIAVSGEMPGLFITEVTNRHTSTYNADGSATNEQKFQYIEFYNYSEEAVDLSDYILLYQDTAAHSLAFVTEGNGSLTVDPGEQYIIGIYSAASAAAGYSMADDTAMAAYWADFNTFYNVDIPAENRALVNFESGLLRSCDAGVTVFAELKKDGETVAKALLPDEGSSKAKNSFAYQFVPGDAGEEQFLFCTGCDPFQLLDEQDITYEEEIFLGSTEALKVLSYNILADNEAYNAPIASRLPLVVRTVENYQPDIVGFQEFNYLWVEQLHEAGKMPKEYAVVEGITANGHTFSTASGIWDTLNPIYYRSDKFTLLESGSSYLSSDGNATTKAWDSTEASRVLTWAVLENKATGEIVNAINTHSYLTGKEARTEAVKCLYEKGAELKNTYGGGIVIIGDHNFFEGSEPYHTYINSGVVTDSKYETIRHNSVTTMEMFGQRSETYGSAIDFCMISPETFAVQKYEVFNGRYQDGIVSDHSGVYTELLYRTAEADADTLLSELEEASSDYFTAESFAAFTAALEEAKTLTDETLQCAALLNAENLPVRNDRIPSVSLYGHRLFWEERTFAVENAADFAAMAALVNEGVLASDVTVVQTKDIDMSSQPNIMVGTGTNRFNSTYDGMGHTISNYTLTSDDADVGMFRYLTGTLKNLYIDKANVTGKSYIAVAVARTYGTKNRIENVHVTDSTLTKKTGGNNGMAILCHMPNGSGSNYTIVDCSVSGCRMVSERTGALWEASYIAAKTNKNTACTIERCYAYNNSLTSASTVNNYGEIAGQFNGGSIKYCGSYNNTDTAGKIKDTNDGGIVGYVGPASDTAATVHIIGCYTDYDAIYGTQPYGTLNVAENCYPAEMAAAITDGTLTAKLNVNTDVLWIQETIPEAPLYDESALDAEIKAIVAEHFTAESRASFTAALTEAEKQTNRTMRYTAKAAAAELLVASGTAAPITLYENRYYKAVTCYAVATAEELEALASLTLSEEITVLQTANIDLLDFEAITFGTADAPFAATYDGQGHKITNYKNTESVANNALFRYLSGALKNLVIEGAEVAGTDYSAIAVALTVGRENTVENVHIVDSTLTHGDTNGGALLVGGPKAAGDLLTIRDCTVSGSTLELVPTTKKRWIAGFITARTLSDGSLISRCYTYDNIMINSGSYAQAEIGGIIGEMSGGTVEYCGSYNNSYSEDLQKIAGIMSYSKANTNVLVENYTDHLYTVYTEKAVDYTESDSFAAQAEEAILDGSLAYSLKQAHGTAWVQKGIPMVAGGMSVTKVIYKAESETLATTYTDHESREITPFTGTPEKENHLFESWNKTVAENGDITYTAVFSYDSTLDIATAAAVDEKIKAIGGISLSSIPALKEAAEAYEVLSEEQKAYVENAALLEKYLAKFSSFGAGDVNMDGRVSIADVTMLLRYGGGYMPLHKLNYFVADLNGDGTVDTADAVALIRVI